ncbi:type II toxin-antitoxin system RelE/ParE family toxin [Pseudoxanthomonas sp. SE1]|uniref:type II toxin-antitoxin system RelE/ParE family toxin n=1 Tax=Pseudoxanthomonas sp. SE1 TaxID=1664560 RepID=UPI00240E7D74|nr:type II toxin-antitoxin system RelE/ParE family toxin [Pseudoxanthomonas sp. SE1]WFC41230.1 type II toxin-antitoxin system RelE/ParE family toxin [Pseudoxanthomonas sp. SE1]
MARIILSDRIADDAARIIEHLREHEVSGFEARFSAIYLGIDALADNPLIGRPYQGPWRELVIGRDSRGYVVLYTYQPLTDVVHVWALRAQREAGYAMEFP